MNLELEQKISIWRQKAVAGTLTKEEMAHAISLMREDRKGASIASDKAKKASKATANIPAADDLLSELGGL